MLSKYQYINPKIVEYYISHRNYARTDDIIKAMLENVYNSHNTNRNDKLPINRFFYTILSNELNEVPMIYDNYEDAIKIANKYIIDEAPDIKQYINNYVDNVRNEHIRTKTDEELEQYVNDKQKEYNDSYGYILSIMDDALDKYVNEYGILDTNINKLGSKTKNFNLSGHLTDEGIFNYINHYGSKNENDNQYTDDYNDNNIKDRIKKIHDFNYIMNDYNDKIQQLKEDHKKQLETELQEQQAEANRSKLEAVAKMKHKLTKDDSDISDSMKSDDEHSDELYKHIILQDKQKQFINKKINEGAYKLSRDELRDVFIRQLNNNPLEANNNGLTKESIDKIIDSIYIEAPKQIKNKIEGNKLLMNNLTSDVSDTLQAGFNDVIEDEYRKSIENHKYKLPVQNIDDFSKTDINEHTVNPMLIKTMKHYINSKAINFNSNYQY